MIHHKCVVPKQYIYISRSEEIDLGPFMFVFCETYSARRVAEHVLQYYDTEHIMENYDTEHVLKTTVTV